MARAIDSEAAYRFLSEQLVKETGAFSKGVNKGLNIARSAMRNPDAIPTLTPPNEWVSVEERLPEDDAPAGRKQITVMVTTKAGKVTIASRVFEPERDYCGKVYPARWVWSRWLNNHVTHWMELPAPYDRRPPEGEA